MCFEAVLVSLRVQGSEKTYETSGILFNSNLVIISGTSLLPFLEQEKWISVFVESSSAELRNNEYINNISFRVFLELNRNNKNEKVYKKIHQLESKPLGVWKCPLISESIRTLFYDWTLSVMNVENKSEVSSNDHIHLSKELISIFILLKCEGEKDLNLTGNDDDFRALPDFLSSLKKPKRGQEVEILSTPFGNTHFINSLSRGVISNVVGYEECIILCDARTVLGCEGGPIFVTQKPWKQEEKRILVGIVTIPLSWWRGEWVGLTIGISLQPVLSRLCKKEEDNCCEDYVDDVLCTYTSDLSTVNFIDETVVFIRSRSSWGAGVILNAASGVIITCSHVVKDGNSVSVFQKGNHFTANIIFKSQDDDAYDLAVLKIEKDFVFMNEANFSLNPPKVGETVIAAGFPFFSERDDANIRPSIAIGNIARVNPYMIQTTCCIQSGFSGGALFRDKELLGIIISNAKDSTAGALFPHINFVLPSSVFEKPILKYMETNNANWLKDLECSDVKVQALWKLQTSKL